MAGKLLAAVKKIGERITELGAGIHDATSRMAEISAMITALMAEDRHILALPDSVEEQYAESDRRVDEAVQRADAVIGNPATNRGMMPLAVLSDHVVTMEAAADLVCWYDPDAAKKRHRKQIKALATGNESSRNEKSQRRAEIAAEIHDRWVEYEALAISFENAGMRVDRDGREPVEIFLEFEPTVRSINTAKFEALELRRAGFMGELDAIRAEANQLRAVDVSLQRELQAQRRAISVSSADATGLQTRIVATDEKLRANLERQARLTRDFAGTAKLLDACRNFRRKHGLDPTLAGMAQF